MEVNNARFPKEVENHAQKFGVSYIDSVIAVCERYGIEPQVAAKFLNKRAEGQNLNLLPKKAKLPI